MNQVLRHVASRRGGSWACHLSAFKPHPPWLAAAPFNAHYSPGEAGLPEHRAPSIAEEGALHPWLAHRLTGASVAPESDDALALLRSQYYAVVEETDDQLGRLFENLRSTGELDRTLVVFTTDHGEQLGDHWLMNKDGFFEQSYHIPLIIRCPAAMAGLSAASHAAVETARGSHVTSFSEHVDILPTILECIGVPVPVQVDGSSLLPFLLGRAAPPSWRTAAHWEFDYRDRSPPAGSEPSACSLCVLRGERWKYVQFADAAMPPLLFDMAESQAENVDLGSSLVPEHVAARADCAAAMLQWRMRHAEHTMTHLNVATTGLSTTKGGQLFTPTANL